MVRARVRSGGPRESPRKRDPVATEDSSRYLTKDSGGHRSRGKVANFPRCRDGEPSSCG